MKKWNEQTPIMSSAALMKVHRQKLWDELKQHPEWPSTQVDKYKTLIARLNKEINRRVYDPEKVLQLVYDCQRQYRVYKRVAKKFKISKRAVKYILKQNRKTNGRKKQVPAKKFTPCQGNIFE